MYHAIFLYNTTIIRLGKATVTNTGGNFVNQYWDTDDPDYSDWSTKKTKLGDVISYVNEDGTKREIGSVSAATTATRGTVAATIPDNVISDFSVKPYNVFIERAELSKNYVYSYPLKNFVGSSAYSDSILSLFFKRTSGKIDEIRLNIEEGEHSTVIARLNREFREAKNTDIIIGSNHRNTREVPYLIGVNKVLTSISENRN